MKIDIDTLIKESMKAKMAVRTSVLRNIKTEFTKASTAKGDGVVDEIAIINKLAKDRENSIKQYKDANREDLALIEEAELHILQEFLPKAATEEDVRAKLTLIAAEGISITKENRGIIMKHIKSTYPTVDMKMVNQIVSEIMK